MQDIHSETTPQLYEVSPKRIRIAIFASGQGSNAQNIIDYFRKNDKIQVALIVSSKKEAGVLQIANKENIPSLTLTKKDFEETGLILELKKHQIDFIVLAGFLWKIPAILIHSFEQKIVNIHPALLPAYGGKGMYGAHVHRAVIEAGEEKSGITIHFADEVYDNGAIIFQASCPVFQYDTPESLAQKIHTLEYLHFPKIIEQVIQTTFGLK